MSPLNARPAGPRSAMKRLLVLLQFTRFALAFTAVADAWAFMLLRPDGAPAPGHLVARLLLTALVAGSVYAFGMTLNDVLDARRDRIFARWRPIPSGRLSPRAGIVIAFSMLLTAVFGAAMLGAVIAHSYVPFSLFVVFVAAVLIVFYNATGKHLGGAGLLTLGAVRAVDCMVGHPTKGVVILPIFLLTHVALVSALAYRLEGKRPRLKPKDFLIVFGGVVLGDALLVGYMALRGSLGAFTQPLICGPLLAMAAYMLWAAWVLKSPLPPRKKGERLIVTGLFWLFAYDAGILLANGQWKAGLAITALGLCSISAFLFLRAWGRMAPRSPQYRVARQDAL